MKTLEDVVVMLERMARRERADADAMRRSGRYDVARDCVATAEIFERAVETIRASMPSVS